MSVINSLKGSYKPYRYTINKSATILESTSGNVVVKKSDKDLFSLFNYLESRGFTTFPKIIMFKDHEYAYEYIDEYNLYDEQKLLDLEPVLSSLHNKTIYFKKTNLDNYKEIRENVLSNVVYLDNYFNTLFLSLLHKEYHSPSEYLFLRSYYKINESLTFCRKEIDEWFDLVSNNDKERVSVVHNNLSLDHFLANSDREVLISWDNYKIDTPILDFVHLYQKEYQNHDFSVFLENYLKHFELLESEKKLLFVLISLPLYFEIGDTSLADTREVKKKIDYLYKTEKLIRPYYTEEKIE